MKSNSPPFTVTTKPLGIWFVYVTDPYTRGRSVYDVSNIETILLINTPDGPYD